MKKNQQMRRALRRSALTVALGMCFSNAVLAQSNTAGAVAGHAAAGDTITVTSASTGFSRTISVGADGSFRLSQLPTGTYVVTRNAAGGATSSRNVTVNVGVASTVDFVQTGGTGGERQLDNVTVVGSRSINPIDVSSVESSTIITAEQINRIPVPRDTTSVALLAPGTVRGDAAFGNLASFGGSSVAENAYFVNGFNVTNAFQNLNFAAVPFEAISEQQVKTGGYGAEFGRSTGGVINQITKRGTNKFHAGANLFWTPESLTKQSRNFYDNNGALTGDNSNDSSSGATANIWAGGALVPDRLFAYGLVQFGTSDSTTYPGRAGGNNTSVSTDAPKYLVKLDWNITDDHHLELTGMSDKSDSKTEYYKTIFPNRNAQNPSDASDPTRGAYQGRGYGESGSWFGVAKYTGYLTDNFTLSALLGHGEFSRSNYSISANGQRNAYYGNVGGTVSGCPIITDARPGVVAGTIPAIVGCSLAGTLGRADAKDTRDQFRIDAEWQLGDHVLRGGIDTDNFESVAGASYSGGAFYRYGNYRINGTTRTDVVRKRVFQSGATVAVDQRAFYLEDSWSITDNFIAYLGLRWDSFDNKNGAGETFAKIDNQFAPRLGVSWNVRGDNSLKVFANAGRYALPLTATVAVRGASASLFSEEYYSYTGVDATTGAPTGLTRVQHPLLGPGQQTRYLNNEFGVAKDPRGITSDNLEPMYQDEYILGAQMALNEHASIGVRGIFRDLKRAIDDTCDYRPIYEYAQANHIDFNPYNPGFAFCHLYNPGSDGIFNVDIDGDGTLEKVTIAADQLGPKAKRTYKAIELFGEANYDRWFVQGSYTYAKNQGNTEGGVKSDIGQADTGTTQDFDYPELALGSYGYLPNDRRHTLKLFGNFDVTDQLSVGANFLVQSGRPINCFGFLDPAIGPALYGNGYFYCNKSLVGQSGTGSVQVPRGTVGRTPWTRTVDLNVAWRPAFAKGNLQFKVDVFNVLNADNAVTVNEFGEDAGGNPDPVNYLSPTGYQRPRSVRFMVQYSF